MVHQDGSFSIIDRKKDLVKLQAGEYVSLVKVELAISQSAYVENVCVYADPNQNFTVCFVSPKISQIRKLGTELGLLEDVSRKVQETLPAERLKDETAVTMAEHQQLCKIKQVSACPNQQLRMRGDCNSNGCILCVGGGADATDTAADDDNDVDSVGYVYWG
ncbi:unnamed protein product [Dibothriocephalus latus]|uniref:Uncharacterized protein n=1 Tax=Dibothriocephalus latus TaxID=60516 RepID=A0A3P7NF59_DIBLA|nr:unnamed protein product [Dibothriocephalus latus]